jgi:hypothetical protein
MRSRLLTALAALSMLVIAAPVAGSVVGHPVEHHCPGCKG